MMKVLTLGTFDCLHYGHIRLFERAARFGPLTAGVNSDRFVLEYKGRAAKENQQRRISNLTPGLGVERAILNDGPGIDVIRALRPDILAIGSDWLDQDYTAQLGTTAETLAELGVSVLFLPRTIGISTTELRAA